LITNFSTSSVRTGIKRKRFWDQSAVANSFFSIATTTVGSGGASDITFSNIPQTYTHLQIRAIFSTSVSERSVRIQFNSDTATNYSYHYLEGYNTTVSSSAASTIAYGLIGVTPASTTYPGSCVADILDYRDTNKFKTVRSIAGGDPNALGSYAWFASSNWRSTSAITSIKLYPSSGNFNQYTQFALYGVLA